MILSQNVIPFWTSIDGAGGDIVSPNTPLKVKNIYTESFLISFLDLRNKLPKYLGQVIFKQLFLKYL